MDRLERSDFLHHLTAQVFLSHYQAMEVLPNRCRRLPEGQLRAAGSVMIVERCGRRRRNPARRHTALP